jgi:hypothetical protein
MSVLVVPGRDNEPWPTLGTAVISWMNEHLVYGPGDIRGEPLKDRPIDPETSAIVCRSYEVHPQMTARAGRRRFHRVALSQRKGTAKTEKLAWFAIAELHPDAPVRFDHWATDFEETSWGHIYKPGEPVGKPVDDPYIPVIAYTEEQVDELLFGAIYSIVSESPAINCDFDIGLQRIIRMDGKGRCVGLAAAPNPRDGARTTAQFFDETHRFNTRKHLETHKVMLANVAGKRAGSEPWTGEATTAFVPGEGSVAEKTQEYAELVEKGDITDPTLFFFHRWAGDPVDLTTREGVEEAFKDASGPARNWDTFDIQLERILSTWEDPGTDLNYFERVWLNRKVMSHAQVFDIPKVREQGVLQVAGRHAKEAREAHETALSTSRDPSADPRERAEATQAARDAERIAATWTVIATERMKNPLPRRRTEITMGFDGSLTSDATGIIGTELETGYQFVLGKWVHPPDPDVEWEVPAEQVDEIFCEAMKDFKVVRAYCDPPFWETYCDKWAGRWPKRVMKWETRHPGPTAYAIRQYVRAWRTGEVSHDGDVTFIEHLSNARKRMLTLKDEEGRETLYLMEKEHRGSPKKIDLAMAGMLSWEARSDAIAKGALRRSGTKAGRSTVKTY